MLYSFTITQLYYPCYYPFTNDKKRWLIQSLEISEIFNIHIQLFSFRQCFISLESSKNSLNSFKSILFPREKANFSGLEFFKYIWKMVKWVRYSFNMCDQTGSILRICHAPLSITRSLIPEHGARKQSCTPGVVSKSKARQNKLYILDWHFFVVFFLSKASFIIGRTLICFSL